MAVPGLGACYLAEQPLGAWVEVFRGTMTNDEAELDIRRLHSVALGRDLRLADLTSRRALAFGIPAAHGAGVDYGPGQALASDAAESGWAGIRYLVRHDPRQRLYGVALFGPGSAPAPSDPAWPMGADVPLDENLIAEAIHRFGYRVLPPPGR